MLIIAKKTDIVMSPGDGKLTDSLTLPTKYCYAPQLIICAPRIWIPLYGAITSVEPCIGDKFASGLINHQLEHFESVLLSPLILPRSCSKSI